MLAPLRPAAVAILLAASAAAQTYRIATVAGGGIPHGVPGVSASLDAPPHGVAVDASGNVFFTNGNTVLRLSAGTAILTLIAGTGANGGGGDNGPVVQAELYNPHGLALDSSGALYIADTYNHRIRKVSNGVITTVAGTGSAGYSGDGGPAVEAALSSPQGVAVDAAGNLFIADSSNGRIRKVSAGVITTVAGNGVWGYSGDNAAATAGQLNDPVAVAVDPAGNLYISDYLNNRVRKVSNGVISTFAGTGIPGFVGEGVAASNAQLNYPAGLALDSAGNLYIADLNNNRIRRVSNGIITTVAGSGGIALGDNGPPLSASLSLPESVAVDPAGRIYIADSLAYRIRRVAAGVITTVAGNGFHSFGGDNGPALHAQISAIGIALDRGGALYLADDSNRIRKVSGGVITTIAGVGQEGFGGDGGPALAAKFSHPAGVAVDPQGNVYVADTLNHRIRKIANGTITTIAGTGVQGFAGDNGPAFNAQLSLPNAVAVNAFGDVYIADSGNYRVRVISNGVIRTFAGTGVAGYNGDDRPALSAQLGGQFNIALDPSGDLYVVDSLNHRVRRVSNGIIRTVAGNGVPGRPLENVPATQTQMQNPASAVADASGNLYISDSGNRIVRKVANGIVNTIAGDGEDGFRGENIPATAAVVTPGALAVDPAGVVLVSDGAHVRSLTPVPTITAGGVANAASFAFGESVAPGSIATAFGYFLVPSLVAASTSPLPTSLAGLALQFDTGAIAPLFAVSPGQVNFQVPWELAGHSPALLTAVVAGRAGFPETLRVAPYAPGIFRMDPATGQGAIVDANYRLADSANPVAPGSVVIVFCTGLGPVTDPPPTGSPAPADRVSPTIALPQVSIGGAPATVLFSGLAPGSVGEYQINVLVPDAAAKGPASPVSITIGGATSNTVTMAIQ